MKKFSGLWAVATCLALVATASADGPQFYSGPATVHLGSAQGDLQPLPEAGPVVVYEEPTAMPEAGCVLFECVKYKDLRNIAPCAVPMVVSVPDPCADPCNSCAVGCVNVKICVPSCGCPEVKIKRHGTKLKLDYGKYSIEVTSDARRGIVVVDYDD